MENFPARHYFFSTEAVLSDSVGQGVEVDVEPIAVDAMEGGYERKIGVLGASEICLSFYVY